MFYMKKIIELVVKLIIYTTFIVPLVLVPSSFIFPFVVPKILLFRSLVELMLAGYVALLVINYEEYRPRLTGITMAVSLFIISFGLSTFIGVDPYHSFWENHERMLGLFTLLHYFIYYVVTTAVFKKWADWRIALHLFLLAGSAAMLVGVMQHFKPDFLLNQGSPRVASTLGNAIYVGGYGLFLFFVGLLLFLKEKILPLRIVQALLAILGFIGMILSGTRGSLLGLMVGIGAVFFSYSLVVKSHPRVRQGFLGVLALLVLVLGLLYVNRQASWVQHIPTLGSLLNISLSNGSASTRLIAWKIAVQGWKERPVFGWGPNNFFYTFNKYYDPTSLEHGYGETWFDNAHNIILNTLTVQGVFGLLTYLGIFAVGIATLFKRVRKPDADTHLMVIGAGFLVAHLVQNITVFENPTSYLYFFFWLAMLNRLGNQGGIFHDSEEGAGVLSSAPDRPLSFGLIGVVGIVSVLLIYVFNVQPARANQQTLATLQALTQDPLGAGLVTMKEALQFSSPHIDDIRSDVSRTATEVLNRYYQKISKEQSNQLIDVSVAALEKNVLLHPADIRNYLLLGQLSQFRAVVNNNAQYILDAERYLQLALSYSPRRQQLLYTLANFKAQVNKANEAAVLLQQAISDDPKIVESYWRLAYLYKLAGRIDLAKDILARAHALGLSFDDQGMQVEAMVMSAASTTPSKK